MNKRKLKAEQRKVLKTQAAREMFAPPGPRYVTLTVKVRETVPHLLREYTKSRGRTMQDWITDAIREKLDKLGGQGEQADATAKSEKDNGS